MSPSTPLAAILLPLIFAVFSFAQSSPNCPLLGPVFPPPNVQSKPVQQLRENFYALLEDSLQNGTTAYGPLDANTTSFYVTVFSEEDTLFDYGYAAPSLNGSLTSGNLDRNTIFRIGSLSKLLTVYTLLAEVGFKYVNDPITKWVPELSTVAAAEACNENPVSNVAWNEVTVGALASHMAGINRDRKSD